MEACMVRRKEAGSAPDHAAMGDRLREVRLSRGLSLRRLAARLGVSASFISQVETGRAKPSVSTLYAIVNELGISLDELLFIDARSVAADIGQPVLIPGLPGFPLPVDPVQRSQERSSIRLASGVVWERLTTASIPNVDFFHVTYEVGGASSSALEFQRHAGQEWGYVISGSLGVRIGFEDYLLGAGDAITFHASTPHRLFNAGDEPVQSVWFVVGRGSAEVGPQAPQPPGDRS
jgi:transcriptional regulator with XRE-family HTH domain